MRKLLALILAAAGALACSKPPELTRDRARAAIEASAAFREPLESGVVFTDTTFRPSPNARREILEVQALTVKNDGPIAGAGQTATLNFTYRWTEGPLAGHTLKSKARLHSAGGDWKAYDDYLKKEL